jgi:hypothetical protein
MPIRLTVEGWTFWSPDTADPRIWQAQENAPCAAVAPKDVRGDLIPAIHRRRMSASCRMGVQTALEIGRDVQVDYLVFCSQHGEVARSEALLESIMDGAELSPTDFSLSVHNTAAGLYSIIKNHTVPSTSMASGASSFAMGWLEAEAYIHANGPARVLLVTHDNVLPDIYRPYVERGCRPYALAVLLARGDARSGALLSVHEPAHAEDRSIGPLFLAWWLSQRPALTVVAERQEFRWTR